MELRQLEIFRALSEELNFTRTAERVHCVQSNVTTQIRSLEAELGVPLFERLGKQVRLTEHGRRLVPYAERILRLLEEARLTVTAGDEPTGALTVGTSESVLTYRLPPVLRAFRKRFPVVELRFHPLSAPQLWQQLQNGGLDLVFLIDDAVADPRLCSETLCPEPLTFLVQPSHPLVTRGRVSPEDLCRETLLLTEPGCTYRRKLERILIQSEVAPQGIIEFAGVEAIKQCAALGMGLAFLPEVTAVAEVADRKLAALTWTGPDVAMSTQVAWHKDKWISPALQAFLELARARLTGGGARIRRHG